MAETSKNKIYYNDNENSVADVLADMKKMAESTDKAIENSKYNDAQIKKDISDAKKEQALKDAEQDNKIIELQNEKAKLETELKEMQEDFYQASVRGQASGEYIHVEDSSGARCRIGISGNHEQKMRSGKNLLLNDTDKGTVNGITFTQDSKGIIKANGTATDAIVVYLGSKFTTIAAGTYRLSDGRNDESKDTFFTYVDCYNTDGSAYATGNLISTSDGSVKTYTESKLIKGRIVVRKGVTLNNIIFKPQLELIKNASGSETEYEEYGASPSPDYPSEVQTVGSNVNIFDKDNPDMFLNGLTPDNSGNIVSTLTDTTKKNYIITIIVPCKGNKQYTISRWLSGKTFIVYESEKNKFNINDKVTLLKRNDNSGIINETIATSANAKYILVKIYSTWGNEENTYNDLISSIKIEKGKVATSYSKYGQGCVKVTKCNKNLLPALKSQSKENKGIIFSYNAETQEFNVKGTTTDTTFYTILTFEELKYLSKDKKYILSISNLMPTKCMVTLTKINVINNGIIHEGEKQTTVDNLDKYKPDGFMFYGQKLEKGTKIDFTFKAQLEESSTATEYEQHEEQTYIMPVQQEMLDGDKFLRQTEKWYEKHGWKKVIFNGKENFQLISNNRFQLNLINAQYPKCIEAYFATNAISNIANGVSLSSLGTITDNYRISANYDSVYFKINEISLEDFKAKLKELYDAGIPVVAYYKLAEPQLLECTEEQSKILDELNNARTYKNVTNITTDSKAILSLDYAKDLETLLTSKESEV